MAVYGTISDPNNCIYETRWTWNTGGSRCRTNGTQFFCCDFNACVQISFEWRIHAGKKRRVPCGITCVCKYDNKTIGENGKCLISSLLALIRESDIIWCIAACKVRWNRKLMLWDFCPYFSVSADRYRLRFRSADYKGIQSKYTKGRAGFYKEYSLEKICYLSICIPCIFHVPVLSASASIRQIINKSGGECR